MEDIGILDVTDEYHLFSLQYVFLDRIKTNLTKFTQAWNHHPLSSEGNLKKLWAVGLIQSNQEPECIMVQAQILKM